jgi:protein KRI1
LKAKYGEKAAQDRLDNDLDEDSSSSEDDDAEAISENIEKDFFKTLACLKRERPEDYTRRLSFSAKMLLWPRRKKFQGKRQENVSGRDLERESQA